MDRHRLRQVDHALFIGCVDHRWEIHARAGVDIVAARGVDAQIVIGHFQFFCGFGVARAVHGEHAPPLTAAIGRMIEIMVKDQHVARLRFQRYAARGFAGQYTKKFFTLVDVNFRSYGRMGKMAQATREKTAAFRPKTYMSQFTQITDWICYPVRMANQNSCLSL
jgi:hypothetical protein